MQNDGLQQGAKGYNQSMTTSGPRFFFSLLASHNDAVSGVWNAFEIRLYDTLINFNDLQLLELGKKFDSKGQLSTVFCANIKLIMILRDIFMLIILIPYIYTA